MTSLTMNLKNKAKIEKSGRYSYYDFSADEIKKIASTPLGLLSVNELRQLVQPLFPDMLQCGGLFDNFLFFEMGKKGQRKDPPKYAYGTFEGTRNHEESDTCLFDEVLQMLEENDITPHPSWLDYQRKFKATRALERSAQ